MAITKSSVSFGIPSPEHSRADVAPDSPFRILLIGDFGAQQSWGRPIAIDRDNIDDVFTKLTVRCKTSLSETSPPIELSFSDREDFHPDRLYSRLELFSSLRTRRQRLEDTATFQEEAGLILNADSTAAKGDAVGEAVPGTADEAIGNADVTADLLAGAIAQTQAAQKPLLQQIADGGVDWDAYVRQLVEPYVVQKADPRQAEFVAGVDAAIAETMRRLLHSPAFQQLEAAWRGIDFLIRRLETDRSLQMFILNVSKQELCDDVCASDDLSRSQTWKLIAESATVPGAEPWTLVMGNYEFGLSESDCELIGRLAAIHASAGAAFVAGASPEIVGCPGFDKSPDPDDWSKVDADAAERWTAMRSQPAAKFVGLCLPRILARRPYGKESDPVESFRFEEIPDGTQHDSYLWMNSAFARVSQLGQAFSQAGWDVTHGFNDEIESLPVFIYEDEGEEVVKPCAEASLSLRAADRIRSFGLSAALSVRDEGTVLMPGLRSLSADDSFHLAGRWIPPR